MSDQPDTPTPTLRASDHEREAHAQALRDHAAAGRLTVDELSDRLEAAYGARTQGELRRVLEDLPDPPRRPERAARAREGLRAHATSFLLVNLLLIGIWAASGAGYFWPIWPLLGWGIGLASHARKLAFGIAPGGRSPRRGTAGLSS
jgi:hypothetical protein